jgi:hypothetical protein
MKQSPEGHRFAILPSSICTLAVLRHQLLGIFENVHHVERVFLMRANGLLATSILLRSSLKTAKEIRSRKIRFRFFQRHEGF